MYFSTLFYYIDTASEIVDALDKCHYEGSTNHDYWVCVITSYQFEFRSN